MKESPVGELSQTPSPGTEAGFDLQGFPRRRGVWRLSDDDSFDRLQSHYLEVREREGRLPDDEAVSRLPEKQRATLILKIYHELTHREVAQILGSTVGTVKANLFHALGNLRKLVAEGGE